MIQKLILNVQRHIEKSVTETYGFSVASVQTNLHIELGFKTLPSIDSLRRMKPEFITLILN